MKGILIPLVMVAYQNNHQTPKIFANQTAIKLVLKESSSFTLLLIMDANQVNLARARSLIELLTSVLRKFNNAGQQI